MPDIKGWNTFLQTILGPELNVTRIDDDNVHFTYAGDVSKVKETLSSHALMRNKVLHALRRDESGVVERLEEASTNPKFAKLKEVFSYDALGALKHLLSDQWLNASCLDAFHDSTRYEGATVTGEHDIIAKPLNETCGNPWVMLHDKKDGVAKWTLTYEDDVARNVAAEQFKRVQSVLSKDPKDLLKTLVDDLPLASAQVTRGKKVEISAFAKDMFEIIPRGEDNLDIIFKYGALLQALQKEYDPLGEFAPVVTSLGDETSREYCISGDSVLLYLGHTFQPPIVFSEDYRPMMFAPPAAAAAEPHVTSSKPLDVTGVLEILLDCSASMFRDGKTNMDYFKDHVDPIIDIFVANNANWVVSVIPFGSTVQIPKVFTNNITLLKDYFRGGIKELGDTALYDGTRTAFSSATTYVGKYPNASVGILIVTDGMQNAGDSTSPIKVVKETTAQLGGKLQTFLCDVGTDNNEFAVMSRDLGFEHIKLQDASQISKLKDWAYQMGVPHIVAEFVALGQKLAAMRVAEGDVKAFGSALPKGTVIKIDGKDYVIGTEDLPVVVADTEPAPLAVDDVEQHQDPFANWFSELSGADGLFNES